METSLLGSGVPCVARSGRRNNIRRINLFSISQTCIEQENIPVGNIYQQAGCSNLPPKSIRGLQRPEMPSQARAGEYCNRLVGHPCRFPCPRRCIRQRLLRTRGRAECSKVICHPAKDRGAVNHRRWANCRGYDVGACPAP